MNSTRAHRLQYTKHNTWSQSGFDGAYTDHTGGIKSCEVEGQDEPQPSASRRPRRATAVAAALRIQGRLERAGIVHDRKAYMQSLSSAVTLAQAQQQRHPEKRSRTFKRDARSAFQDATCLRQQDTSAHVDSVPYDRADLHRTTISQSVTPGADCSLAARARSPRVHAPTNVLQTNDQRNALTSTQRQQDVNTKIGSCNLQPRSIAHTLAKSPPKPGAKLVPARVRQVHSMPSPQIPAVNCDALPRDAHGDLAANQVADWTDAECKRLLHICSRKVRPDTSKFWVKVAQNMPGRSVYECFEKYFEAQKTPPRPKRPAPECPMGAGPSVIANDQCLTAAKKKKAVRSLRWQVQAMQTDTDASGLSEKRERQQKVDTFIDSYKRKRHAPASQASAGRCGDVQFRSGQRESLPATSAFVGSEHTDPDVRTSEQAIAALKKWHVIEVSARLQDTPERDWYHCGSAGESGSETGE